MSKEEVLDISPVLFLDASGHSMHFYVRPGSTKMQLHPLITNGGGTLCRNQEPSAILLIDPADVNSISANTGQKYISSKYIKDCIEQNQQLDLNDYVITVGPSVQTRMASRNQGNGRLGYSSEEDAAILKFMEKRQHEAKGNLVWKEMEKRRITEHSWQSMRDRFLKHLQHKLFDKSAKKRKPLSFLPSPLKKKKATDMSEPEIVTSQKSDCCVTTENIVCPGVSTNPPPSPERASSPPDVPDVAGEHSQASSNGSHVETCVSVQEQEISEPEMMEKLILDEDDDEQEMPDESDEHSSLNTMCQTTFKTSTTDSRSSRTEDIHDGQDIPDESDEQSSMDRTGILTLQTSTSESRTPGIDQSHEGQDDSDGSNAVSSPSKKRQTNSKTSTPDSKKLGILAKAAREFEDSDVDESEEGENPCKVPNAEPSCAQESSASSAISAREQESQAEHHDGSQPASPTPEEEHPGPSITVVPPSFNSSSSTNCSQVRGTPEETVSGVLMEVKEHVISLMRETKKDLVEVTKALFKASGDLKRAQMYLLEGYDLERHGHLWTRLDDEILLLADPYELEQLRSKFGEEEVTRRKAFLNTSLN